MDESASRREITRVLAKSSPNGKITVFLGKRDFVDHFSHVDPIDGVILIDPEYVRDRRVFGHVLAVLRYGCDDLDISLGLIHSKELYLAREQIYPPLDGHGCSSMNVAADPLAELATSTMASTVNDLRQKRILTRLQECLIKQLGPDAFPFYFELPPHCTPSVTMLPSPNDTPCGVDYELKVYVGEAKDDKPDIRNSVQLSIRKIMYAPDSIGDQPSIVVSKEMFMSPDKLRLEASLNKKLYYHGEEIVVNLHIANNSNRTVKKIHVSVRQTADSSQFASVKHNVIVAEVESDTGFTVAPGVSLSKVFTLTPLLANNMNKWRLALDGQVNNVDTNLASSTIISEPTQRAHLGIIIQYKVKVMLYLGFFGGELTADLPIMLMHPKPEKDILPQMCSPVCKEGSSNSDDQAQHAAVSMSTASTSTAFHQNLMQLEGIDILDYDKDFIFEDFSRLSIKTSQTE